jgi:hypothetical protein
MARTGSRCVISVETTFEYPNGCRCSNQAEPGRRRVTQLHLELYFTWGITTSAGKKIKNRLYFSGVVKVLLGKYMDFVNNNRCVILGLLFTFILFLSAGRGPTPARFFLRNGDAYNFSKKNCKRHRFL